MIVIFRRAHRSLTNERAARFEGDIVARYKYASGFTKDKEVLDIGSGLGAGAYFIAKKGAQKVLGIDYSRPAISYAKRHFCLQNLDFKTMDAVDLLDLDELFDVVIAFEIVEHLPIGSRSHFVKNINKILRPNGVFLISTPNKLVSSPDRDKPYNPYHTKEFTPDELKRLCQRYFSNTKLLGLRCINENYLAKSKAFENSSNHKIISFVTQFKIVHGLLPFIPIQLKSKITHKDSFPRLRDEDFKISRKNIADCENLIAICPKTKKTTSLEPSPRIETS